jgi:PleD family two-component response regulator
VPERATGHLAGRAPEGRARDGSDLVELPDIEPQPLYSANDLARFCAVDPKTIHNWASRGKLPHSRTTGRHLRFRRVAILEFLKEYGYPIPAALGAVKARVIVVHAVPQVLSLAVRALGRRFEATPFADPFDALLALAPVDPDALALDADGAWIDGVRCVERLRAHLETRHLRVVVLTDDERTRAAAAKAGVLDVIPRADVAALVEAFETSLPLPARARRGL